jgi:hypothetical protein
MERQAKDGTIYQQVGQDEWTPVTRQARDGTTYKKVGADQWTPLSNDSEKSLGSSILDGITSVSNKIDSYTGAPTRAAAAAAQEGKNPITAFKAQFGEDNSKAPSFHDIAVRAGVSDSHKFVRSAADQQAFDEKYNPGLAQARKQGKGYSDEYTFSPADVAGVVGDAALDWTNVAIPLGAEAIKGLRALKVGATAADAAHGVRQVSEGVLAQRAGATADAAAKTSAEVKGGGLSVEQGGQLFKYKAPESLDELKNWKSPSGAGEQVGAQRLKEIENVVPDLEVKPLKYHYSMMENPKAMKELKLKFENLPTEDAKRIAAYNQEMVDESARKIQQTASDLAGGEPRNLTDAGYDLIGQVKDKYKTEKAELGPLFNEIQKRSPKLGPLESRDLIQAIGETSNLGKLIEIHPETGRFSLGKNTPRTGLSDAEHGILSRVIDDLNDGMTFKELQDTREFLRKAIDPANPAATIEVSKVRSILLGQLENMASKAGPDVGQVFKKYAINERSREAIESIIGGKIESLDAMFSANPDKVVQKIFSNPNYAKIVGEYVGQDTMKQMVGSYLQTGINKSIDSAKGFQPSKFKSWLKSNENFIRANV